MPLTTSLIVPSPPAATIRSKPSATALARQVLGFARARRRTKEGVATQRAQPLRPAPRTFARARLGFRMTQVLDKEINLLGGFHLFFNRALRSFHPVKKLGRLLLWLLGGVMVLAAPSF